MNLSQLGLSTMNAARARLITAGHNINNANTPGYSRQSVIVSTAGATATGGGFLGRGVQIDTVRRSYDTFLSNQFVSAQSKGAMLAAYGNQVGQINNLIADNTVGISPAMQKFFDGIQAVASTPADPAARQELLGRTQSMVGQFNEMNTFLNNQRNDVNGQVQTVVTQINSHLHRVAELNKQIEIAKGSTGQVPNDLLDQRDQEVADLNLLARVNVLEHNGQYTLTIGNGQLVVSGADAYGLTAKPSDADPRNMSVYVSVPAGNGEALIELDAGLIQGGSLAGLLTYRDENLDAVQRQLGQLATGLALAMNAQQIQGLDLTGKPGTPMFLFGQPDQVANAQNRGTGQLTASINPDGAGDLRASDYDIKFDGANFRVTRQPDDVQVLFGASLDNAQIDGMTVSVGGAPLAGDSWKLMPTRDAGGKLQVALATPDQFAAASLEGGSANGDNMLVLAALQTAKILGGGTMNFNESYSQIVNKVAVHTQQNSAEAKAQAALIEQSYSAQQAVSGVNLDEEYVNLDRFQEQYVAASKLIEISASLFDTLIGIRA
ncbi:flagellar hook-associated protein FlgK [Bordetella sp. 02P26C-1]|uniref:flagellar hook-associated protein FlgK n=1 Tax=Bordetella sp. 02P26C-1 TaxID=2683195 RepID=UPI00135500F9|nr:flagellar hook-associated protein FlgK [Bordetella sp. 02P26C-1]MVW78188.1 flagellar hook-associated protein FlgK [Bordetella sp. 02P26C-1]